jgi:microsomal dipeptidase-like Zn-dependent dipeptidase
MKYVEDLCSNMPTSLPIAKSPQEVRDLVTHTKKTIILYSLEGGKALVGSEEDAQFWADKGVAFITLIHMLDSELGGSASGLAIISRSSISKAHYAARKKRLTDLGKKCHSMVGQCRHHDRYIAHV